MYVYTCSYENKMLQYIKFNYQGRTTSSLYRKTNVAKEENYCTF